MTFLFNKSLAHSRIPSAWEWQTTHSCLKKKEKEKSNKFSLSHNKLSIKENLRRKQLHSFKAILSTENQYGFRKNRSSLTNLLDSSNYMYTNLVVRVPDDVIYQDFHDVFDTVPQIA